MLPKSERGALPRVFEVSMRSNAPAQPMSTPTTFLVVMGSLMKIAAKIMVIIGVSVTTIEASTGEVVESPTTKVVWFSTMPKTEARTNRRMSFLLASGARKTRAASQKATAAPMYLKQVSASGDMS